MNIIEVEISNGGLYQKGFDSSLISSISFLIGHTDGRYTQSVACYSSPAGLYDEVEQKYVAPPPPTQVPDLKLAYEKAKQKAHMMAKAKGRAHTLSLLINGHFYASEQIGQEFNRKAAPTFRSKKRRSL